MAETTQFTFSLSEVAELLVKRQGLNNGKWIVGFEFGFGAAHMGPSPESSAPTALVQVVKVLLSAASAELPPNASAVVDAAAVNPEVSKASKKPPREPQKRLKVKGAA